VNITSRRTIAISATGAAVVGALCLGAASPALAQANTQGSGTNVGFFTPPTLEQEKAWYATSVDNWENWLARSAAKVAASDHFTDAQKADYATQAAAAKQALDNLKAAIAAATTRDDLVTALQNGWNQVQWPQWPKPQQDQNAPVLTDAQRLAKIQTRTDAAVAGIETKLDSKAAKVAADDQLTDQQKADYVAQVSTAKQELDALKAAVDAATTPDQARTALRNGWASIDWPQSPDKVRVKHHHRHHKSGFDPSKSARGGDKQTFTSSPSRGQKGHGPADYNKAGTYTVKADTWNSRTPYRSHSSHVSQGGDHAHAGSSGHGSFGGH